MFTTLETTLQSQNHKMCRKIFYFDQEADSLKFIDYRYMIDDNRAIFMFKDGSQAWEAKDYLLQQERCESVSLENKVYPGKGSPNYGKDEL